MGEKYKGYSLLFPEDKELDVEELHQRGEEIGYERLEGDEVLGWSFDDVVPERNSHVVGRFTDKKGKFEGYLHGRVLDGGIIDILVPPVKANKIG